MVSGGHPAALEPRPRTAPPGPGPPRSCLRPTWERAQRAQRRLSWSTPFAPRRQQVRLGPRSQGWLGGCRPAPRLRPGRAGLCLQGALRLAQSAPAGSDPRGGSPASRGSRRRRGRAGRGSGARSGRARLQGGARALQPRSRATPSVTPGAFFPLPLAAPAPPSLPFPPPNYPKRSRGRRPQCRHVGPRRVTSSGRQLPDPAQAWRSRRLRRRRARGPGPGASPAER